MKIRMILLICLICVIVLAMGYQASTAKPKPQSQAGKPSLNIGIVSILKIYQDCKRNGEYRKESAAERNKIEAKLNKLQAEIEAEKAGLQTLKPESDDHMARINEILQKQASYQAQEEFYKQQIALKERRWAEDVYKDILLITNKVAEQKGLDMVLEKDEPMLPSSSYSELMTIISTHKVLYSKGCVDITDEVMAALDAQ